MDEEVGSTEKQLLQDALENFTVQLWEEEAPKKIWTMAAIKVSSMNAAVVVVSILSTVCTSNS